MSDDEEDLYNMPYHEKVVKDILCWCEGTPVDDEDFVPFDTTTLTAKVIARDAQILQLQLQASLQITQVENAKLHRQISDLNSRMNSIKGNIKKGRYS